MKKYALILFTVAVIGWFVLNKSPNNSTAESNSSITPEEVKQNINDNVDTAKTVEVLETRNFTDSITRIESKKDCGYNPNDLYDKRELHLNSGKSLTDIQEKAFNDLMSVCQGWYDYASKMDDKTKEADAKNEAERRKIGPSLMIPNEYNVEVISTARKHLVENEDDDDYFGFSLIYLLQHDREFINEILSHLGSKDNNLVINNSVQITKLFNCRKDSKSCSSKSTLMLELCLTNEDHCNKSYEQMVAETKTMNQMADINHIVDIINELIRTDYFMDHEEVTPNSVGS